jgi:hypothetical protein
MASRSITSKHGDQENGSVLTADPDCLAAHTIERGNELGPDLLGEHVLTISIVRASVTSRDAVCASFRKVVRIATEPAPLII